MINIGKKVIVIGKHEQVIIHRDVFVDVVDGVLAFVYDIDGNCVSTIKETGLSEVK